MKDKLKRATWLELFYDLAYVALVAQLTYLAADNFSTLSDWLNIFIIGYTIFLAWWGTTANRNMQDSESTNDKLLIQFQMATAFMMSLTMPGVFADNFIPYFLTLGVIRFLQVFMMYRMYRLYPEHAPATKNIAYGIAIAGLLWMISGFWPTPYHFVFAFAALALDVLAPLSHGRGNTTRLLNINHLQERLGLFLMLVVGEAMLVVAIANTATSFGFTRPLIVFSGLMLVIALWWLYYDYQERCAEGIRPSNLFMYLHAHGFLFGSIILLAAGFKNAIEHISPTETDTIFIGLGLLGLCIALGIIRTALHGFCKVILIRFAIGVVLVVAPLIIGVERGEILTGLILTTIIFVGFAVYDFRVGPIRLQK